MVELSGLTIEKAHDSLKRGEYTCKELAEAYLSAIKEKNGKLNAYLEIYDDVLKQAEHATAVFASGHETIITGIPFAIKDNILFQDHIASAGSKILQNYRASYSASVVRLLVQAGAVILGRTNMDEFAMGSSTEYSAFGPTRNPHDLSRVPGGTSGGSAAALAADMALCTIGTETCGSVREPAAFCGVVGLKPTYGALSRHGVIAMGNSLDQVSPFGRSVRDAELIFKQLSKYDPEDSTSVPEVLREKIRTHDRSSIRNKIGVPWHLFKDDLNPVIMENFQESLKKLTSLGYNIVNIELPHAQYSLAVYYIIMPAEVSTNLSRFDGIRYGFHKDGKNLLEVYKKSRAEGFGAEARRRILLGTYVLSHGYYDAYYQKAVQLRMKIKREMQDTLKQVNLILTPTVPFLPFKLGERLDDPVSMYLCDLFNAPANLAGMPSIAIPSGKTKEGLPFSIQFTAPHWGEDLLFAVGKKFEQAV